VYTQHTIIAAGAVVLENTIANREASMPGTARKVKDISPNVSGEITRIANNYVRYAIGSRVQGLARARKY